MEEKNNNPITPEIKPGETKNPSETGTPINTFSPPPDPIKFASPFSLANQKNPVDAAPKTPVDSLPKSGPAKETSSIKIETSSNPFSDIKTDPSSVKNNSINSDLAVEKKKSSTALMVIITIILVIAASIITGVLVYAWQSSQMGTVQKDKALLQGQVGNLKSQVDVLQKEKADIQVDLDGIMAELTQLKTTAPAAPTESAQPAPAPAAPAPANQPAPAPNPGQ